MATHPNWKKRMNAVGHSIGRRNKVRYCGGEGEEEGLGEI
jgi:hypothetical protein